MSFKFPSSRDEISQRIKSDIKGQLPTSNPFLRNSLLLSIAYALAGRTFDIYKTIKNVIEQLFWNTATGSYLERHASIFGLERNAATISSGKVTAYGVAATSIPIGTQLQGSDGETYETQVTKVLALETVTLTSLTQTAGLATATCPSNHNFARGLPVTIAGANETEYNGLVTILSVPTANTFTYAVDSGAASPATGTITASATIATLEVESLNTGQETNKDSGEELTFTSPIAGVQDIAYVQFDEISQGTDLESDDDFQTRFLFRVQNPVALFNNAAIENKAKEISGVTRVWVENVDTTQGSLTASSVTSANNVAIFTTAAPHGLQDGQKVTITGANEPEYNVSVGRIIVISTTKFAYVISGAPASPATGTVLAAYSLVEEGQVKIFFVRDNDAAIIPSAAEILTTKNKILEIKPAHVSDDDVIVKAPTANTVNFTFNSISPDTSTMEDAIEANLSAFFSEKTEVGQDITLNELITAIQNTIDPENNQPLVSFDLTTPAADVSIGREELGVLGSVTF